MHVDSVVEQARERQFSDTGKMEGKRIDRSVFVGLGVLLAASAAHAAPSCHGLSATVMNFAAYDVFAGLPNDTATATISYSCPPPASPTVQISAGNGGSFNPWRTMTLTGGTDTLNYNVYFDPGRTVIWGTTALSVPQ